MVTQVVYLFLSIALHLQLVLLLHWVIGPESSQVMRLVQSHVQALRLDSGRRCRGADHRRGSTNCHHLCSPRAPVVTDRRRECIRRIFDESLAWQPFSCCFSLCLYGCFWPIPACRARLVSTHCGRSNCSYCLPSAHGDRSFAR